MDVAVELPPKLIPVFTDGPDETVRYRGAYGGRGSAKTRSFAKMAAIRGYMLAAAGQSGIILCGREFQNSLDESSMEEVKAAIASEEWLASHYEVGEKYIRTRSHLPGRIDFKFAGLAKNIDSIKSKSRIHIMWVDEAEPVSEAAWSKITPTVREQDSEIWVTWNPERMHSATNERFRLKATPDMKIVECNWSDNPWFPDVLDGERRRDLKVRPDEYDHVWGGDYVTVVKGAYYAEHLTAAKSQNRIIENMSIDPMLTIYSVDDIGGAGAKADSYTKWIFQVVGESVRFLDYYEAQGQTLGYHAKWMRDSGYESAKILLPHDGVNVNSVTGKRYEDHWRDAGFAVEVIPNQGRGAASQRIESTRRVFGNFYFDKHKTEAGRETLKFYRANYDEERGIDLGPVHDFASHCADAIGIVGVKYDDLSKPRKSYDGPLVPNQGTIS